MTCLKISRCTLGSCPKRAMFSFIGKRRSLHLEERWITIGYAVTEETVVVVHTYKELRGLEIIRIISARHSTRREKTQYEERI